MVTFGLPMKDLIVKFTLNHSNDCFQRSREICSQCRPWLGKGRGEKGRLKTIINSVFSKAWVRFYIYIYIFRFRFIYRFIYIYIDCSFQVFCVLECFSILSSFFYQQLLPFRILCRAFYLGNTSSFISLLPFRGKMLTLSRYVQQGKLQSADTEVELAAKLGNRLQGRLRPQQLQEVWLPELPCGFSWGFIINMSS